MSKTAVLPARCKFHRAHGNPLSKIVGDGRKEHKHLKCRHESVEPAVFKNRALHSELTGSTDPYRKKMTGRDESLYTHARVRDCDWHHCAVLCALSMKRVGGETAGRNSTCDPASMMSFPNILNFGQRYVRRPGSASHEKELFKL